MRWFNIHAIGVHGLADQELVVAEVGNDLLGESGCTLLELLDLLLTGVPCGKGLLDLLHVACKFNQSPVRPHVKRVAAYP